MKVFRFFFWEGGSKVFRLFGGAANSSSKSSPPLTRLILAPIDQSISTLGCLLLVAKQRALLRRALHIPFPVALVANVQSWLGSPKLGMFGTGFECFEVLVESSLRTRWYSTKWREIVPTMSWCLASKSLSWTVPFQHHPVGVGRCTVVYNIKSCWKGREDSSWSSCKARKTSGLAPWQGGKFFRARCWGQEVVGWNPAGKEECQDKSKLSLAAAAAAAPAAAAAAAAAAAGVSGLVCVEGKGELNDKSVWDI